MTWYHGYGTIYYLIFFLLLLSCCRVHVMNINYHGELSFNHRTRSRELCVKKLGRRTHVR